MDKIRRLFTAIVLIACVAPAFLMFILGESEPGTNEIRVSAPKLFFEDKTLNKNILSDLTDYMGKRFSFRQELITLNSQVITTVFGTSPVYDVIYGKGGWLYYKSTVNDYRGTNILEDSDIEEIADKLLEFQEECTKNGAKFLFVLVPNKSSVYPEYMPDSGKAYSEKGNRTALFDAMKNRGVSYIDLKKAFDSEAEILYHKTDSHWNNLGAAIAADEILTALGHEAEDFAGGNYVRVNDFEGDLHRMLYPKSDEKDENIKFSRENTYSYDAPIRGADSMIIKTTCEGKSDNLLVFRDSFGNALYPFLAESFGKSVFLRKTPYTVDLAVENEADTVIIVMAERNLYRFSEFID